MIGPGSLDELARLVRRPASVGRLLVGRRSPALGASILGAVAVARPDEPWPTYRGEPMVGLAQLNVADAPAVPDALRDIALLTVFIGLDGEALEIPDGRANGDGWLVRSYPGLDDLAAINDPPAPAWLRRRLLAWDRIEDLPALEDLLDIVDGEALDRLLDGGDFGTAVGSPASGTKLGGWPDLIQGEIAWHSQPAAGSPEFCLQIDSDERLGLNLWDGGAIYLGRQTAGGSAGWIASAQFM